MSKASPARWMRRYASRTSRMFPLVGRDAAFEDGNRTVASVARSSEGRVSGSGGWRDHVQSWLNIRENQSSRCLRLKC